MNLGEPSAYKLLEDEFKSCSSAEFPSVEHLPPGQSSSLRDNSGCSQAWQTIWDIHEVLMWGAMCLNRLIRPVFFNLQPSCGGGCQFISLHHAGSVAIVVAFFSVRCRHVLQQDNALAHGVLVARTFQWQNNMPAVLWSALGPDLNSTENQKDVIKRLMNMLPSGLVNAAALRKVILRQWDKVPAASLATLQNSMQYRSNLTISMACGHIRCWGFP